MNRYPEAPDHIWFRTANGKLKCALCGAITAKLPGRPTPEDWQAERYEKLTDEERAKAKIIM